MGISHLSIYEYPWLPWRVGRKVGRTIYVQRGKEVADDDILIGMLDTIELAKHVVAVHNKTIGVRGAKPFDS